MQSKTFRSGAKLLSALGTAAAILAVQVGCSGRNMAGPTTFKVTITNVTDKTPVNTVISTGVAITHNEHFRLFEAGRQDAGLGLEGIAEDGNKWILIKSLSKRPEVLDQITFDTPVGATRAENIGGGKRYEFFIAASPAYPYLSLASMVGFTNDLIFALDDIGAIREGQTGQLILTAMPQNRLPFTVVKITPVSRPEEGRNYFSVEGRLDEASDRLRPGMEGLGKILVDQRRLIWIWTHDLIDWARLKFWTWSP